MAAVICLGVALLPSVAAAASLGLSTVKEVNAYPTFIGAGFDAFPANQCGGSTYKVAGENPTPIERARLAFLTAALLSGKQVWISTGGCDASVPGLEEIVFVGLYE